MRIFCALELPDEVKSKIAEHITLLRGLAPDNNARWERTEKLHLTLKFLGEIESARVADLQNAATQAVATVSAFNLIVSGTGAFPPRGMPRVLWLGLKDESGQLSLLQKQLEDEAARSDFPREERPFHPHLTIARLKPSKETKELARIHQQTTFQEQTFPVSELVIMQSQLHPTGSRYTVISRHQFRG